MDAISDIKQTLSGIAGNTIMKRMVNK